MSNVSIVELGTETLHAPAAELLLAAELPPLAAGASVDSGLVVSLDIAALRVIDLTSTHGTDITLARLEEMAAAYDPTIEAAALNLDHAWRGPALGWCESLWVQDQVLWSRWIDLDPQTVELIRARRYSRQSSELTTLHSATGGWYFTGLALLGNASPAVWGLPPVKLMRPVFIFRKEGSMSEKTTTATAAPPPAEATAAAAPTPPVTPTAVELAQIREGIELSQRLRAENAALQSKLFLDGLGSKVSPAVRRIAAPLLTTLFAAAESPFTVKLAAASGGEAVDTSALDAVKALLSAMPDFVALGMGEMAGADATTAANATTAAYGISSERLQELKHRQPQAFAK